MTEREKNRLVRRMERKLKKAALGITNEVMFDQEFKRGLYDPKLRAFATAIFARFSQSIRRSASALRKRGMPCGK